MELVISLQTKIPEGQFIGLPAGGKFNCR